MSADPHKHDKTTGLRHLFNASQNSLRGLAIAWRNEAAFRQASTMAILLSPVGLWLGTTGVERALLVGSLLLMLMVELLNSGIEAVVDRVGLERHVLSGIAKDVASAAVALTVVNAAIVWLLVLWPHYGPDLFA
jgi:diacylglycerol kinase (ATP)